MSVEDRLDRMEEKIDRVSEAIIAMARMEERMVSVFKRMDHPDAAIKRFDERMDAEEKQSVAREQKIALQKEFWMVCTGAIGLAFVYLR